MLRYACLVLLGGIFAWPAQSQAQQFDGFQGPSILSRGSRPIGKSGGRPIRFRGFAGVGTGYYGGLVRAGTDSSGRLTDEEGISGVASWGVYGNKAGKRSSGSASYNGSAQIFGRRRYFSGINQSLGLTYSTMLNRRWSAFAGANAGEQNLILGVNSSAFVQEYFDRPVTATNEVFDSRFYSLSGGAGLSYQKSARMTFSFSGAGQTVKRRAAGFVGQEGYTAQAEMSYAFSRRTKFGVAYSFGDVFFRKAYGESFIHSAIASWGRQLDPHWSLTVGGGAYAVKSDRIQVIQVDPLVAALTGQTAAPQAFHNTTSGLAASAGLNGSYRKQALGVGYNRGASPGNGLYLTSAQESVNAHYSYTGLRRANVGVQANYSKMRPLLQTVQNLGLWESYGVGAGFGYRITNYLHFSVGGQTYQARAQGTQLNQLRYGVNAGIYFSPGDIPLILW